MKLQVVVLVIVQIVGQELREQRRLDELHARLSIRKLRMLVNRQGCAGPRVETRVAAGWCWWQESNLQLADFKFFLVCELLEMP